jgi:hypothetical protein
MFTIMAVGLMFCLALLGYQLPVTGGIMNAVGIINQSDTQTNLLFNNFNDINTQSDNSNIFNKLAYILGGLAIAGIAISFFGRAPDVNMLLAGVIVLLAGLITADYIWIIQKVMSFNIAWISWSLGALFTALMVGFYISIIEFWRGSD